MNKELETLGKQTPFTVPEGFFEQMHESIAQAIGKEEKRRKRTAILRWSMSAAAAIIIAVTAFTVLQPSAVDMGNQTLLADNNIDVESMSDEALNEWVTLTDNDEFLYCDNMVETNY